MEHESVDLGQGEARLVERGADHLGQGAQGVVAYGPALHSEQVLACLPRRVVGRPAGAPGDHLDIVVMLPVGGKVNRVDAIAVRHLAQQHGAGTVTEQAHRSTVRAIHQRRIDVRADDEAALSGQPCRQHGLGDRQRVDEPAADGVDVERRHFGQSELVLHDRRGGGLGLIRRRGGHHDQSKALSTLVKLVGVDAGERDSCRFHREIGGSGARSDVMPGLDTGACRDPSGLHARPLRDCRIGNDGGRNEAA